MKKKLLQKLLALSMAAAMTVSMAGCGNDSDSKDSSVQESQAQESSEQGSAEESSAEQDSQE